MSRFRHQSFENRLQTELFRRHYSWTRPRNQVYLALLQRGPLSISQLIAIVGPGVNQATIYRAINLFLKLGITVRTAQGLIELAPPFRHQRYHLICTTCGRRTDFWDEQIDAAIKRVAARRGHQLAAQQLDLTGECRLCYNKTR